MGQQPHGGNSNDIDDQVARFLEISSIVNSTDTFKTTLKVLSQKAAQACRVDRCSIFLFRDGRFQPVMAQFASGVPHPELWSRFKAFGSYTMEHFPAFRRCFSTGEAVLVEDAQNNPGVPRAWSKSFDIKSLFVVPLMSHDKCVGMMHLDNTYSTTELTQREVRLANAIAEQLALAIDNARLMEETRMRLKETETLLEVSETISTTLDLNELVNRINRRALELMSADEACIYLAGANGHLTLKQRVCSPESGTSGSAPAWLELVHVTKLMESPAGRMNSFSSADVPNDERVRRLGLGSEVRSMFVALLLHRNQIEGVLLCLWRNERQLDHQLERLMEGLARQASLAIANARLYAHAEELAVRRERMRMAAELHDKMSQVLFSIGLKLDWSLQRMKSQSTGVKAKLHEMKRDLALVMTDVRDMIYEWSFDAPRHTRLAERLCKLVEQFQELSGTAVEYAVEGDLQRIGGELEDALFKTFQEAFANVAKHAHASRASLNLRVDDDLVEFEIADNGTGASKDNHVAAGRNFHPHFGLKFMHERIARLGGELRISPNQPVGLRVAGKIPLARDG